MLQLTLVMKKILSHRNIYIGIALTIIVVVILMIHGVGRSNKVEQITTAVEVGSVREVISVSGIAKSEQIAELAFPVSGIIKKVSVSIGETVETGDIIAELDTKALSADRQDALAAVERALADRDELISGPSASARNLTGETVASKKAALANTKADEAQKIKSAYSKLLSSDLTAYSNSSDEDAVPPTISGTYSCEEEGEYILEVFSSAANSGYSFNLSGIETGTFEASVDQPTALGKCGLRIIFDASSRYSNSNWIIEIPNTKASSYVTNRNAYALAVTQSESAINAAEQAVTLAEASANDQNAPARSEAITRADAVVSQAYAKLARIDATISDGILRAPFPGTITELDILPGETVTTAPIATLLASSEFEVTARIPEIDIGKLLIGQKVEMVFDARASEILTGEVSFISLKETEIDGVSYYEAIIKLKELPTWIRSGLNADVEIIISEQTDSLRIPKRFAIKTADGYEVLVKKNEVTATTSIKVELEGNNGYFAITGLNEGDILIAP